MVAELSGAEAGVPPESWKMLKAVAEQSAESGVSTVLRAVTEVIRRVPHRFAALTRRNVYFLDDSFMCIRQAVDAAVRPRRLTLQNVETPGWFSP
jgi:hypothetical protein